MRSVLDGPADGIAETILVRELEDEFSGRDDDWLEREHERLTSQSSSPRGIRRGNWLRLQAVRYVLMARALNAAGASDMI